MSLNLSTYATSLIRTIVPVLVGAVIGWLSSITWLVALFGIDEISADQQASFTATVVGVAIALYYAAVRRLEARYPWLGYLLGVKTQPVYIGEVKAEHAVSGGYEPIDLDPMEQPDEQPTK